MKNVMMKISILSLVISISFVFYAIYIMEHKKEQIQPSPQSVQIDTVYQESFPEHIDKILKDKDNKITVVKQQYQNATRNIVHRDSIIFELILKSQIDSSEKAQLLSLLNEEKLEYYKTEFKLKHREFNSDIYAFSPCPVDSIKMISVMNKQYVDSICVICFNDGFQNGLDSYPMWKKIAYAASGAVFTALIVSLVK